MINTDYDEFSVNYLNWLNENIESSILDNGVVKMTLPYLDKDNDEIELYIVPEGDGRYQITDDGATIGNLEFGGFSFNSPHRKNILLGIVNSFGVELNESDNSLRVHCNTDEMPIRKHMLAQCMVKVSDLFCLTRNNVQNVFLDDVRSFFDVNGVRYIENILLTGKSKLETHYDFAIPKSTDRPERIIQVINTLDVLTAKSTVFSWTDTHENRKPDTRLLAIINDDEKRPSGTAITVLKEYGIDPVLWSKKDMRKEDFIA